MTDGGIDGTHLAIANNKAALLVAGNKHELFVDACIELLRRRMNEIRWSARGRGKAIVTHLVESCEHMTEIRHRPASLVDLMENIVAEELDKVSVTSFRPPRIVVKPAVLAQREWTFVVVPGSAPPKGARRLGSKRQKETHSGRSLMKPNLKSKRVRRPFSSSRMSSCSRVSSALCTRMLSTLLQHHE